MSFIYVYNNIISILIHRNHYLLMLFKLEMVVEVLYFVLYIYFSSMFNELFFFMSYLKSSICEGVLGLSMLVSMIRGNLLNIFYFILYFYISVFKFNLYF